MRYLTFLVHNKDIKAKHLVNYCRLNLTQYLRQLNEHYNWLENTYAEFAKKEILDPEFHKEVLDLEEFWKDKDMGISRWRKIFRYKKRKEFFAMFQLNIVSVHLQTLLSYYYLFSI